MGLRGFPIAFGQGDFVSSSTAVHLIGTPAVDNLGRRFRYALAGAADLVAGNALQSPAWDTQQVNLAVAANAAIGATTVTVTNGTTAITLNQYAGGLLVVETTPGEGYSYRIAGNSAAANGATITLTIEQPGLIVALTAAGSKVSMALNPYSGVIQAPITTLTGTPVGVATYIIKATQYGWIGTGGSHGTLIYGTPALGVSVSMPSGAAGAVAVNSGTLAIAGYIGQTGVDGKIKNVNWTID